ncbi:uncharacterized protein TA07330 [Theileria annulata]|uniref:Transcription initiation factor TFIID subunit 2 n=1 Tax=Theileria annulata TaxID=5874 RepID=Q4UA79_THEAN|nr:uncharacterized protein TA07330 [Theileria annulata]CAI76274.1 hypothetical protein, conserved [Theileria annulata]|eukprot:XP_952898.1 hypothetical protein, conserved [Theileria annulata]
MLGYNLIYQKVDVALDFENYTLKGSTHLKLKSTFSEPDFSQATPNLTELDESEPKESKKNVLRINLPLIGNPVYKRVLLNDVEVNPYIIKPLTNNISSSVLNSSISSVDLMSYEGLHFSAQSLNDSFMFVEVNPLKEEIDLDIQFDYYDMNPMNSEVYFQKHWILPRGSTNYKLYKLFVTDKFSNFWFPTFINVDNSVPTKLEVNVTVPIQYSVVCGLKLKEDVEQRSDLEHRNVNNQQLKKTYQFYSDYDNNTDNTVKDVEIPSVNKDKDNTQNDSPSVNDTVDNTQDDSPTVNKDTDNNDVNVDNNSKDDNTDNKDPNNSKPEEGNSILPNLVHKLPIFVGEFDYFDGSTEGKKNEITEEGETEEEMAQLSSHSYEFKPDSKLVYVTLRGFGYLLNPTNVATTLCLETYKGFLEPQFNIDQTGLYLLFLPYGSFPENADISACIRTQNYLDFNRCSAFTSPENYLFCSFTDSLTQTYHNLYYNSRNIVVYSLEVLHSFGDLTHDPNCINKRIVIANGLSSLYTKPIKEASKELYLNLMLQSYLVDQFVKRNLGVSEFKLRLWAKRELFATLVELIGDFYPLTTGPPNYSPKSTTNMTNGNGDTKKESAKDDSQKTSDEAEMYDRDVITEHVLMSDKVFLLKCQLIPNILESIVTNTNFLNESFMIHFFNYFLNRFPGTKVVNDPSSNEQRQEPQFDKEIWDWILQEVILRYVIFWNNKPQNRLNKEKQLDPTMTLEDILKKGVEHDQLNVCMTNLQNLIKSFVYGTGCPQISMGLILQLQRKGTSMDHLSFRIDVTSLQPPLDINKEGQTKYNLVNITSQGSKNLFNVYSSLLSLTHYSGSSNQLNSVLNNRNINNTLYSNQVNDHYSSHHNNSIFPNNHQNDGMDGEKGLYRMLLKIYNVLPTGLRDDIVDFGDLRDNLGLMSFSEIGLLRKKMCLFQAFFDSLDMIGRDGNFVMGFGYIGNYPWTFCLGYGPLWDCLEMLKVSCDINKINDLLVDNGTNYCGTHIKTNYKLQYNPGQLPIGTSGGMPYWKIILIQQSLIQQHQNINQSNKDLISDIYIWLACYKTVLVLCLSGGYAKKWMFNLVSDIVEDDGVRESVRLLGDLVPVSYNVNPRAKRGRKKVALKGMAEDLENDLQNNTNFNYNQGICPTYLYTIRCLGNNTYLGIYSDCDRYLIEWMKHLYMGLHPELTQLDNRSIVARICSKTRLPLLWIRVDSSFSLLARIRRCQSGSMWEQQLYSDNNIYSLIEASQALGSIGKSEYISDNPLIESACKRLDNMIKKHKSHPVIRARCMYSLMCLYNRDPRQHKYLHGVFTKYLTSFSNLATHPTETRFIMEYYKALCLLRNEFGFTPDFVLDILCNAIENLSGADMPIQGANLLECASYLNFPSDSSHYTTRRNSVYNLWELLWHMFRLDGIPGSCSYGRLLTSKFLICLSRQLLFLKFCESKFMNEKDLGFSFDPLLFIPLTQHALHKVHSVFELSQTYNSKLVQRSAIRLSLHLLLHCSYSFQFSYDNSVTDNKLNGQNQEDPLYSILMNETVQESNLIGKLEKVDVDTRVMMLRNNLGLLHSVKCACFLFYVLRDYELKHDLWEIFYRVVFDTCLSKPIIFMDLSDKVLEDSRKYLLLVLKKASVTKQPFYLNLFPKIHKLYYTLFGFGTILPNDPKPDQNLINRYVFNIYAY